jgi:hypothetical protein
LFSWNRFIERLGVAGYSFDNYAGNTLSYPTNGAFYTPPDAFWFTSYQRLPPGGGTSWEKLASPGGVRCNQLGLFFVAHGQGGDLELLVSTNSGPWTSLLSLNAYSPTPVGRYTNTSLPLNYYRLRVVSHTGTNVILGPQLLNTQSNGVHAAFIEEAGISLFQVTNVPLSIRQPIFHALSPNLLIWHMKEDGSPETLQHLTDCDQAWSESIPDCNVVYIGTPYVSLDTTSNWTPDQNAIVRQVAVAFQRTYMDCMTPAVSYDWMRTNGFMIDETHENLAGNTYLANFVWNSLNFFSLRVPRRLSLSSVSKTNAILSWLTTNNILYQLESSSNLTSWHSRYSVAGDGLTKSYTNTPPDGFYRLRLTPN